MNAKSPELRVKRLEPIPIGSKERVEAPGSSLLALDSRPSALGFPRGVTLIELLISIAIIATLAVMFLGASRYAMESARSARTKTTIAKLHTLIMEQYASYETRRVDIDPAFENAVNAISDPTIRGLVLADIRLLATREMMKYEMPDRWSDCVAINTSSLRTSTPLVSSILKVSPAVSKMYYRRFMQAVESTNEDEDLIFSHQSAECLYLTVMYLTGDGEARTLFNRQDIGDKDGDGAPEFLDGWGNPIAWVRWPAGFLPRSAVMTGDTATDHDPFDPFQRNLVTALPNASSTPSISAVYTNTLAPLQPSILHLRNVGPTALLSPGFRLVPLIYSSGPDGISDINHSNGTSVMAAEVSLDPYAIDPDGASSLSFPPNAPAYQFGQPFDNPDAPDGDDNSIDNITNHTMEGR